MTTHQNCIHEEINSRSNSGNSCYRSVHNLLSSCLLSKNLKIKIYKTIILPFVLCGFDNRVLRIFWIYEVASGGKLEKTT
jgi:hypothetical protein